MGRGKKLISFLGQRLQQSISNGAVGTSTAKSGDQIAAQVVRQGQQTRSAAAQAATAVATKATATSSILPSSVVPAVSTDIFGAISAITEGTRVEEGVFKNVDGHRFEDGRYKAFTEEITSFIPAERQFTDAVRTFAYGTDASFYR